jgi:hypothetical protein
MRLLAAMKKIVHLLKNCAGRKKIFSKLPASAKPEPISANLK